MSRTRLIRPFIGGVAMLALAGAIGLSSAEAALTPSGAGSPQHDARPNTPTTEKTSKSVQNITIHTNRDTSADGESQTIELQVKKDDTDSNEQVELRINGNKFDVKSLDEAMELLHDRGIEFDLMPGPDNLRLKKVAPPAAAAPTPPKTPRILFKTAPTPPAPSAEAPRAMLGVGLDPISDDLRIWLDLEPGQGVLVTQVFDGTPAAEAGLQARDLITAVTSVDTKSGDAQRQPVNDASLRKLISTSTPDTEITLHVLRGSRSLDIDVVLGSWDASRFGERNTEDEVRLFTIPGLDDEALNLRLKEIERLFEGQNLKDLDLKIKELLPDDFKFELKTPEGFDTGRYFFFGSPDGDSRTLEVLPETGDGETEREQRFEMQIPQAPAAPRVPDEQREVMRRQMEEMQRQLEVQMQQMQQMLEQLQQMQERPAAPKANENIKEDGRRSADPSPATDA